jgi:hypothetical protein
MCNEFVHDNNGVIISEWIRHVNKHTKKKRTQKQIEGQTKCKHKFKHNIGSES